MTGLDDEVVRNQAAAAGGVAFLRKPFPAQTLFDAIKKASGAGLRSARLGGDAVERYCCIHPVSIVAV